MRWLAAEPYGAPGLVLAHWWVVRVPKTLGLLPTHWQMKVDPRDFARLLAGRAGTWSLAAGPTDLRAHFRLLVEGEVLHTVGFGFWGVPKVLLACWWSGPGPSWSQDRVWQAVGS